MPVNKNALLRFQILDRCLTGKQRKMDIEELLSHLNEKLEDAGYKPIRRRQLYDDISAMREIMDKSVEILSRRDGRRSYLKYSEPDYTIFTLPLSQEELLFFEPALDLLGSVAGLPQFKMMKELLPKIQSRVGYKTITREIMYLDGSYALEGIEHLQPLYFAIRDQQVLEIANQPYGAQKPKIIRFHPHILKEYNNRWFVLGSKEGHSNKITIIALDRISSLKTLSGDYVPSVVVWSDYFKEIIGVSKDIGKTSQSIRLRFSPSRFHYVRTKQLHNSQIVTGPQEITIEVKHNLELESAILFFGNDVEVLEPEELRNVIGKRLSAASKNHETVAEVPGL